MQEHISLVSQPVCDASRWRRAYAFRRNHPCQLSIVLLQCDDVNITPKIHSLKPVCVLFLNIPKYSSGMTPWGHPTGNEFQVQSIDDKLIEVLAFTMNQLVSCLHNLRYSYLVATT